MVKHKWGLNPDYFTDHDCGFYLRAMEQIKTLGFDGVLGFGPLWPEHHGSTLALSDIKKGLADTELSLMQLHTDWKNMASPDENERREATDFYKRWADYALELEAEELVIHPGAPFPVRDRRRAVKLYVNSLTELAEHIKGTTLKLSLENEGGEIEPEYRFGCTPSELRDIIEGVDSEGQIGICLDTSHAVSGGLDLKDAICQGGRYIISTHLHDTSIPDREEHLPPGKGLIDWRAVMKVFKKIEYSGPYIFEVDIIDTNVSWGEKVRFIRESKQLIESLS